MLELGRGHGRDRGVEARRHPAGAHRPARQGQLLAGGRDRARAASARRSSTTAARSTPAAIPNCGPGHCDRYMEIYNLVFMEYDLQPGNVLVRLPTPERRHGHRASSAPRACCRTSTRSSTPTASALIMDWVERESGVAYRDSEVSTRAHRVLADHGARRQLPDRRGRRAVERRPRLHLPPPAPPRDPAGEPHRPRRRLPAARRRDRADGRRVPAAARARRRDRARRARRGGALLARRSRAA